MTSQDQEHDSPKQQRTAALPLPKHWLILIISLLVGVLALGLTAKYLSGLGAAELSFDQALSRAHTPLLTALAKVLEVVFGPIFGPLLVLLLGIGIWLFRRNAVDAFCFVALACSGWVLSEVFKLIVARPRPDPSLLFDPLSPETGSNSFPSGHTCFAVALALAFYLLARSSKWRGLIAGLGLLVALTVAWSRLYIGVHYPSDVLASFAASLAGVIIFAALWNYFGARVLGRFRLFAVLKEPTPTVRGGTE